MSILLVEDQRFLREAIRMLLREVSRGLPVVEAASCAEAVRRIGEYAAQPVLATTADDPWPAHEFRQFAIVLLDLNLSDTAGLDTLERIRAAAPSSTIVILSAIDEPDVIARAIDRGAAGFMHKRDASPVTLIATIRKILAGGVHIATTALGGRLGGPGAPAVPREDVGLALWNRLTPRQKQVLRSVIRGASNKVVARELGGIAEPTVKAHVSAILQKIGVNNRTEAVYMAAHYGWIMDA